MLAGAAGIVALSVMDFAALFPHPETASTDNDSDVGTVGKRMVILLESVAFTLTSCEPVGKVQR